MTGRHKNKNSALDRANRPAVRVFLREQGEDKREKNNVEKSKWQKIKCSNRK